MTVKRNGDRVVLKDGKVSCSCCGCCMYPAQALADGDYTENDLPDAVILNYDLVEDFELTRSGSEFIGGIYKIALGTLPNSTETQWLLYVNNERDNNNPCLITGDGGLTPGDDIVEDQFADTYTVSNDTISVTVTRIDVCNWIGTDSCGNDASLTYTNEIIGGEPYKWIASAYYYNTSCDPDAAPLSGYKEGNQNTPIGTYQNGVTVS